LVLLVVSGQQIGHLPGKHTFVLRFQIGEATPLRLRTLVERVEQQANHLVKGAFSEVSVRIVMVDTVKKANRLPGARHRVVKIGVAVEHFVFVRREFLKRFDQLFEFDQLRGFVQIQIVAICLRPELLNHHRFSSAKKGFVNLYAVFGRNLIKRRDAGFELQFIDAEGVVGNQLAARKNHAVERERIVVLFGVEECGGRFHQSDVHPDVVARIGLVELWDPGGQGFKIFSLNQSVDHLHDGIPFMRIILCMLNHIGKGFNGQIVLPKLMVRVPEGHVQNQQIRDRISGRIRLRWILRAVGLFHDFAVLVFNVALRNIRLFAFFLCGRRRGGSFEFGTHVFGRTGQGISGHPHTGPKFSQFKQTGGPEFHCLVPLRGRTQPRIGFEQRVGYGQFVFLNPDGSELKAHILGHGKNPVIFTFLRPLQIGLQIGNRLCRPSGIQEKIRFFQHFIGAHLLHLRRSGKIQDE